MSITSFGSETPAKKLLKVNIKKLTDIEDVEVDTLIKSPGLKQRSPLIKSQKSLSSNNKKKHVNNVITKVRDRIKLKTMDAEKKFLKYNIKPFENLETFINAKDLMKELNPIEEKKESNKVKAKRAIQKLKKIHEVSSNYFGSHISNLSNPVSPNLKKGDSNEKSKSSFTEKFQNAQTDISSNQKSKMKGKEKLEAKGRTHSMSPKLERENSMKKLGKSQLSNSLIKKLKLFREMRRRSSVSFQELLSRVKEKQNPNINHSLLFSVVDEIKDSEFEGLIPQNLSEVSDLNFLENLTKLEEYELALRVRKHAKSSSAPSESLFKYHLNGLETYLKEITTKVKKKLDEDNEIQKVEDGYMQFMKKSEKAIRLLRFASKKIYNDKNNVIVHPMARTLGHFKTLSLGEKYDNSEKYQRTSTSSFMTTAIPFGLHPKLVESYKQESKNGLSQINEKANGKMKKRTGLEIGAKVSFAQNLVIETKRGSTGIQTPQIPLIHKQTRSSMLFHNHTLKAHKNLIPDFFKKYAKQRLRGILCDLDDIEIEYEGNKNEIQKLSKTCTEAFLEAKERLNPELDSLVLTLQKPKYTLNLINFKAGTRKLNNL